MPYFTPCTPDQIRSLVDGYQIYTWQGYDCARLADGRIVLVCESVKTPAAEPAPSGKDAAIQQACGLIAGIVSGWLCGKMAKR
jgi:hypothetical protein